MFSPNLMAALSVAVGLAEVPVLEPEGVDEGVNEEEDEGVVLFGFRLLAFA